MRSQVQKLLENPIEMMQLIMVVRLQLAADFFLLLLLEVHLHALLYLLQHKFFQLLIIGQIDTAIFKV